MLKYFTACYTRYSYIPDQYSILHINMTCFMETSLDTVKQQKLARSQWKSIYREIIYHTHSNAGIGT